MCSCIAPPVLRTQAFWWAERACKSICSLDGEKQLLRAGWDLWARGMLAEGWGQYVQPGATGTVVQMWELLRARVLGGEIAGLSMMMLVDKWEKAEGSLEPREWPWT